MDEKNKRRNFEILMNLYKKFQQKSDTTNTESNGIDKEYLITSCILSELSEQFGFYECPGNIYLMEYIHERGFEYATEPNEKIRKEMIAPVVASFMKKIDEHTKNKTIIKS